MSQSSFREGVASRRVLPSPPPLRVSLHMCRPSRRLRATTLLRNPVKRGCDWLPWAAAAVGGGGVCSALHQQVRVGCYKGFYGDSIAIRFSCNQSLSGPEPLNQHHDHRRRRRRFLSSGQVCSCQAETPGRTPNQSPLSAFVNSSRAPVGAENWVVSGATAPQLYLGSAVSAGCHGSTFIPEFIVSPWVWDTMMRPHPGLTSACPRLWAEL